MKQLKVRIFSDGKVQSTTEGIKGKACLNYLGLLEEITGARAVDSDYTGEYYEGENFLKEDICEERKLMSGD